MSHLLVKDDDFEIYLKTCIMRNDDQTQTILNRNLKVLKEQYLNDAEIQNLCKKFKELCVMDDQSPGYSHTKFTLSFLNNVYLPIIRRVDGQQIADILLKELSVPKRFQAHCWFNM